MVQGHTFVWSFLLFMPPNSLEVGGPYLYLTIHMTFYRTFLWSFQVLLILWLSHISAIAIGDLPLDDFISKHYLQRQNRDPQERVFKLVIT